MKPINVEITMGTTLRFRTYGPTECQVIDDYLLSVNRDKQILQRADRKTDVVMLYRCYFADEITANQIGNIH
ncbi:MAG: hypothetical protein WA667_21575 [Candidatus Nitrosopolaris sp.]